MLIKGNILSPLFFPFETVEKRAAESVAAAV